MKTHRAAPSTHAISAEGSLPPRYDTLARRPGNSASTRSGHSSTALQRERNNAQRAQKLVKMNTALRHTPFVRGTLEVKIYSRRRLARTISAEDLPTRTRPHCAAARALRRSRSPHRVLRGVRFESPRQACPEQKNNCKDIILKTSSQTPAKTASFQTHPKSHPNDITQDKRQDRNIPKTCPQETLQKHPKNTQTSQS